MPLPIPAGNPALLIRKSAFERTGLTRAAFDEALGLTPDEFRVERDLVLIGPIHEESSFQSLLDQLEAAGLVYFQDYFDLGGNWPDWLSLWASTD
ncbi:MAG TPA: hypothetical protein VKZ41_03000 [Gemmatimonadales bacterium]|nr:hypothetical protein [Gemmatimonadales bacterium]